MSMKIVTILVVLVALFDTSLACNGYKAVIKKIENCAGPDAVITIEEGFSIKLNKKCELIPTGCIINKAFTKAVAKFTLKKDNMLMKEGTTDLCEAAGSANGEAKNFMKIFAVPESCPVIEEKICANEHKADLSKYKHMLSMARGTIVIDSTIEHDTGKSCFHVEMEITK